MRGNWSILVGLGLALATSSASSAAAQQAASSTAPAPSAEDSALIARLTYPLGFNGKRISGPGLGKLLEASKNAQFVLLSEYLWHVDNATPAFAAALFRELHARNAFNYYAAEQDYLGAQRVSQQPLRGNVQRIAAFVRRTPYALTFVNDEELRLMAEVGRTSTGKGQPYWGFDQTFGATAPLEELRALATTANQRTAVDALLSMARDTERPVPDFGDWRGIRDFETGHFISRQSVALLPRLRSLRETFGPRPGSRAAELIDELYESALIYSYYARAGEKSTPEGVPVAWFNTSVRERAMRRHFMANYRNAQRLDGKLPKVLVKAGSKHLVEGRTPGTYTFPIGNFFHELAASNGLEAVNVLMLPIQAGDGAKFEALPAELQVLLVSKDVGKPTLVDLRPLRNHFHAGRMFGLSGQALPNFRDLVYGADFALFLPSRMDSFALTGSPKNS